MKGKGKRVKGEGFEKCTHKLHFITPLGDRDLKVPPDKVLNE